MEVIHSANDNLNPTTAIGNLAISKSADTGLALRDFVEALARNQARIEHQQSAGAANDNTIH